MENLCIIYNPIISCKKTSFGESLAESLAYNPIRDSRRDFSHQKVMVRIICMTLGKTLSETRFFLREIRVLMFMKNLWIQYLIENYLLLRIFSFVIWVSNTNNNLKIQ